MSTHVLDVLCQSHPDCQARIAATAAAAAASASSAVPVAASSAASPAPVSSAFVLILLNQPLDSFFEALWTNAAFRICADGGANRLFDHYRTNADRRSHLPDCITGDLDSIRADVLAFYTTDAAAAARTLVRRDPDQDSTDLEKCIAWIRRAEAQAKRTASVQSKQQAQQPEQGTNNASADVSASSAARLLAPVPTLAVPATAAAAASASSLPGVPAPTPSPSPAGLEEWHSAEGTAVAQAFFASCPRLRSLPLLLYPAFGGRFDQQVAMLHAMHKAARWCDDVIMIAEGNSARILMPTSAPTQGAAEAEAKGADAVAAAAAAPSSSLPPPPRSVHRLPIHPCLELGHHCGLYPLGAAADSVSTTGLQWNLSSQRMEWGALISTNNIIREAEVTVTTDQALVWTTEMQHERVLKPTDDAAKKE